MRFVSLFRNVLKGRTAITASLKIEMAKFNTIRTMSTKAYGNGIF